MQADVALSYTFTTQRATRWVMAFLVGNICNEGLCCESHTAGCSAGCSWLPDSYICRHQTEIRGKAVAPPTAIICCRFEGWQRLESGKVIWQFHVYRLICVAAAGLLPIAIASRFWTLMTAVGLWHHGCKAGPVRVVC